MFCVFVYCSYTRQVCPGPWRVGVYRTGVLRPVDGVWSLHV